MSDAPAWMTIAASVAIPFLAGAGLIVITILKWQARRGA